MKIDSKLGDGFTSFVCTESGWGNLMSDDHKIGLKVAHGYLDLEEFQFTRIAPFTGIEEITLGDDMVAFRLEKGDEQSGIHFDQLLKLDEGDELVITLK